MFRLLLPFDYWLIAAQLHCVSITSFLRRLLRSFPAAFSFWVFFFGFLVFFFPQLKIVAARNVISKQKYFPFYYLSLGFFFFNENSSSLSLNPSPSLPQLLWNPTGIHRELPCRALKLLANCTLEPIPNRIPSRTTIKLLWNGAQCVPQLLWNCSETALTHIGWRRGPIDPMKRSHYVTVAWKALHPSPFITEWWRH